MALHNELHAIYLSMVESANTRIVEYPNTVAGVNLVSDGAAAANAWSAYVEIVAALAVAARCWILGVSLGLPQVEAFYGDIAIASGAAGFEVDLAVLPCGTNVMPVAEWDQPVLLFPVPILVIAQPRLAARIRKNTGVSAAGFNNCKIIAATGIGT